MRIFTSMIELLKYLAIFTGIIVGVATLLITIQEFTQIYIHKKSQTEQ